MKNKFVKIGGILIVFLALAALIGSTMTFAQDETPETPEVPETSEPVEEATSGDTTPIVPMFGNFGHARGGPRFFTKEAYDQTLADELDITVEELVAAQEAARQTLLQQAVAEGNITQEQADAIISGEGLRSVMSEIFNADTVKTAVADALGMSVEELDAAQAAGKRLSDIASEQGVALSAVQEAVQAAHKAAITQAVADGLLTQQQADQLQNRGPGFGGRGGFGGPRGNHGGFGGPRGGMNGNGMGFGPGFQSQPETLQGDNG